MFKCDTCKKTSEPRTRMNKIIVETRPRSYYNIIVKHKIVKRPRFLQFINKDSRKIAELEKFGWKVVRENFSRGTEIVKETRVCEKCVKILSK